MPFTGAHPAAVLPLRYLGPRLFNWSALVIGTFTPDFEYFVRLRPVAVHGKTIAGSFYFCLPAGLLAYYAFHGLLREPALRLLPRSHSKPLSASSREDPLWSIRSVPVLCLSVLLGAWSHQVWDSFTHAGRWGTTSLSFLNEAAFESGGFHLQWFKILQYFSTVVGLAALAFVYAQWHRQSSERGSSSPAGVQHWSMPKQAAALGIPLLGATIFAAYAARSFEGMEFWYEFVGRFAVSFISFTLVVLFIAGVAIKLRSGPASTPPEQSGGAGVESGVAIE